MYGPLRKAIKWKLLQIACKIFIYRGVQKEGRGWTDHLSKLHSRKQKKKKKDRTTYHVEIACFTELKYED